MDRGKVETQSIIFEFGSHQPIENEDLVNETIRKEHELFNEVADINQAGRRRLKRAEKTIPELAVCHEKVDEIETRINALYDQQRQARGRNSCVTAPDEREIDAAKAERTTAKDELKATRLRYSDQLKPTADEIDAEYGIGARGGKYGTRVAKALKQSGVYWGTYLKILESVNIAAGNVSKKKKKKPFMPDGRPRKITPWAERPKKRHGRKLENGLIAVHIQGRTLRPEDMFGDDTFVRIDPLPANAFDPSVPRGQRKKLQRTMIHLRVGSDGRKPIWATWPIFMHRPLPQHTEDRSCAVTWIVMTRTLREHLFRYEWKLQITLEIESPPPKLTGESVAINLGWRRMHAEPLLGDDQGPTGPRQDGELRVATWADTAGRTGELRLGASFRERIRKSWELRSVRDNLMNALQRDLCALGVPCGLWDSPKRFHNLLAEELALKGTPQYDTRRVDLLSTWAYRDKHLYWFERGSREGALNYRRDEYRRFALFCATQYKAVIVEDYDIRDIAENADMPKNLGCQRVESAPSVARQILRSTGARLGCTFPGDSDDDSDNPNGPNNKSWKATQKCHICGCDEPWDAAPNVMHTCVACGNTWDQDVNNVLNMLASVSDMLKTLDPLACRKKKRSARFAKKHQRNKDKPPEEPKE